MAFFLCILDLFSAREEGELSRHGRHPVIYNRLQVCSGLAAAAAVAAAATAAAA